ncbi:glycosyltransferase family 9 protein [Candidatus Kapabacteria bacterium]|nr:glycosyltransferase family 9 protein [Candidatus Kapabacteria bacterium]
MEKFTNNEFDDIYVLHTAFLGDIFISYHFINQLKFNNPNSKIHFITTPIMSEPSKKISSIDNVLSFDKRNTQKKLVDSKNYGLKFSKNSLTISLHKSLRSSVLTYFSNSREKLVWGDASLSLLFKNKIKYQFHLHERDRLNKFLNIFKNVTLTEQLPKVNFNNKNDIIENTILIFPGSVWATKKWKIEHYIDLASSLKNKGEDVLICGSKGELDICDIISKNSNVKSLAGELDLVDLMQLVSKAKIVVCNDSAPTHIANLFGTKVLTIFGPTTPDFGFAPYNGEFIYSEEKCSPCNIHGPKECPIGTHQCMVNIRPESMLSKIESMN